MATTLRQSISAMSSSDSLTPKPTPRIKRRVASYHTTKVITHKATYSKLKLCPKIGCHGNIPSIDGPTSNTWFLRPILAHNPKGISVGSTVFAQMTAECPYTIKWEESFPLKIAPFHGDLDPHLIHGSLGPPESSTQTTSRSVQPFL